MTGKAFLSDAQADSILDSYERINLWSGAIRSGKTIASILAWMRYVATGPPGPLAMIGKTTQTLARNVLDVIADEISPGAITFTRGAPTATVMGRLVHIVGASDARSEGRIRGLTLAGAYVDEATLVPEAFWMQLLGRLSVPGSRVFATTNPEGPAHWLKTGFIDRSDEVSMRHFVFTFEDNPALSEEYKAQLRASHVGLWKKRFVDGLWVAAEGAVYDMLDEALHVAKAPQTVGQCWLGIDYGTSNPTHAVLLATDWQNGRLHAVAEWRHDGRAQRALTDAELSKQLQTWVASLKLDHEGIMPILDPSAASMRVQMRNDGWHTQPADNRVLDGIRSVSNLFAQGRLVIDTEKCPELWRELQGYVWDPKAQAQGEDKPVKQNDHGADALRYAVMAAWPVWRAWTGLTLAAAA